MASIRQLDDDVVALIAAGEVVERPASAVKELAENAIDAGATSVAIDIQRGGFDLIRVRDDGAGIDPADLPLALSRHATSKLRCADDLYDVRTLGFRGEALASIAAVGRLRIVTRTAANAGGRMIGAVAGTIDEEGAIAAPIGTTVTVEGLFFNVPARHAFQRSPFGEARAIVQLLSQIALATPTIRWQVRVDGRDVLTTPGDGSLREALIAVAGPAISPHLLDIPDNAEADGSLAVSGVAGSPSVHRNTRMHCTFVVNGRVVRSQSLSHSVQEAYHAMLPHGRYPVACIHLTVPPSEIDVNVHPTKLEVRLRRERLAFARVRDAVRRALDAHAPAPSVTPTLPTWTEGAVQQTALVRPRAGFLLPIEGSRATGSTASRAPIALSPNVWPFVRPVGVSAAGEDDSSPLVDLVEHHSGPASSARDRHGGGPDPATVVDVRPSDPADLATWRPLGQVGLTYIVVEAPDGMYLIDQHSAHERVQYEALKAGASSGPPPQQPLLVPETVELTATQGMWLRGHVSVLTNLGYDLEPFSESFGNRLADGWTSHAWIVRGVPWPVAARGRAAEIGSLIDGLVEREFGDGPIDDQARWAVACHSSVRAGDRLSLPEMQALLQQLSRCDLRLTCPHGRPTMIHLSHSQLAREFGRSAPTVRRS